MLHLFERLTPNIVKNLTRNKEIAIGWVSEQGEVFEKLYTANGNWTNEDLELAAKQLGLTRWDPRPELKRESEDRGGRRCRASLD